MPSNDILNCDAKDLWSILDSDKAYDNERWLLSKGVGMIELSKLGEMLGVGSCDDLMAGFDFVGEPREEGPWPQTIPNTLIERLANITDDEIASTIPHWVEMEEFRGDATVESLTDYLRQLRDYLSKRSGDFFLVNAL